MKTSQSGAESRLTIQVLIIEDDAGDALLLREMLSEAPIPFRVETVPTLEKAKTRLALGDIDVILSDLTLPDSPARETFAALYALAPLIPIIVLTGMDDEELGLETVESGAQEYLVKGDVNSALLVRSIRYALKRAEADRELARERNLLRSVIDNIYDAVFAKDASGRYILGNAAHARRLKVNSADEIIGKTSFDFFPEEAAQRFTEDDRKVMSTGEPIVNRHEFTGGPAGRWLSTTKVPLRDPSGQVIGIVGIGRDITARKQAEEQVARYTRELQDKNELMEDDLKMAREVQQAFLPQQFPVFPRTAAAQDSRLRFYSRYLPAATLGGDFFHVLRISDTEAGVFICDVMGHGVRAALITAIERALVEELTELAREPGRFLTEMNSSLMAILHRTKTPLFASAFYCLADLATGVLRYANAGHPSPLHIRRGAGTVTPLDGGGVRPGSALGVIQGSNYSTHETPIATHDLVLLFTDGIYDVENERGEFFDRDTLTRTIASRVHLGPEEIFEHTLADVRRFSGREEFVDDVCLVAMEVQEIGSIPSPP